MEGRKGCEWMGERGEMKDPRGLMRERRKGERKEDHHSPRGNLRG